MTILMWVRPPLSVNDEVEAARATIAVNGLRLAGAADKILQNTETVFCKPTTVGLQKSVSCVRPVESGLAEALGTSLLQKVLQKIVPLTSV
ncbi:hypothetical protein [Paraburkholderia domus]|uniref:hypothetical protein n=1 Tax=Paraburkholderia domus TaxID=2793075 RepID=UPI001B8C0CA4|nr:hypothetical protein [Paraburkholderia domus]